LGNNVFFLRAGGLNVLIALLVLLVLGAGTGAAVCRFADVSCHINPYGDVAAPDELDDFAAQGGGEMGLAEGLTASVIASGLRYPTDLSFLPDGRILVAEKDGLVRIVQDGKVARRPFLDLRDRVNTHFFRGVVDVTVDADFSRQPFVYVAYAVPGARPASSPEPTTVRLSRFRVHGDVAVLASEKVLLGSENPARGSCRQLPRGADCLPAEIEHIGTDMVFTPRGTIFVSTGDGGGREAVEQPAFAAQDPDTLGGKILHIDREGRGLPGNPYWNGDPEANRSKVWATGLRNPFRMSAVPGHPEVLVVGDVGWDSYEELDVVRRGFDLGWPCMEGPERTPLYQDTRFCRRYYDEHAPVGPWYFVRQTNALSITAGVPLDDATGWPSEFAGQYVFGDWTTSEISVVPLELAAPAPPPRTIANHAAGPVAFALRPEGLYVVAVNTGELRLIAPR
jgi:glucose/arabinose dehydrogenase